MLVAVNAIYGGIGLVVNGMGMPSEWLDRLPVDTWTLARRRPRAHRRGAPAGGGVVRLAQGPAGRGDRAGRGAALVLWIAVQLLVLQRYFFLQPVIAGFGVLEMALAWWWIHRSRTAT